MKKDFFYCLRCKTVPLIELAPKENQLKILTSCQCHKQLLKEETFFKYYHNIDNNTELKPESKKENNTHINKLIQDYQENKDKYINNITNIKDEIINKCKNAIERIEKAFELNKKINEKIDAIIQILINAYNINSVDLINKKNIVLNLQLNTNNITNCLNHVNLSSSVNSITNYFQNNYIIISKSFQQIKTFSDTNEMIEIKNDLFALKSKEKYIKIIESKNNDKWIILKNKTKINKLLIDIKNSYLISLDIQTIKFWDINKIEKTFNKSNKNEFVDLTPLYKLKHKNKILELVVMDNNILCGSEEKSLFTYKYDINQKSHELLKILDISPTPQKLTTIKRKDTNFLLCKYDNYLILFDIPQLTEINRIQIIGKWKSDICCYEQISENEIIVGINRSLKILNLDNFMFTLSKEINMAIICITKLKDNSILIGGSKLIKRFSLQTLEELPRLIVFDQNNSDYEEDYFIGQRLQDLEKEVQGIKELSNGNIMLLFKYNINIYGLNIDS